MNECRADKLWLPSRGINRTGPNRCCWSANAMCKCNVQMQCANATCKCNVQMQCANAMCKCNARTLQKKFHQRACIWCCDCASVFGVGFDVDSIAQHSNAIALVSLFQNSINVPAMRLPKLWLRVCIWCCVVLCCVVLCCVLCCVVLCCIVLCCVVLCCIVLCCVFDVDWIGWHEATGEEEEEDESEFDGTEEEEEDDEEFDGEDEVPEPPTHSLTVHLWNQCIHPSIVYLPGPKY